MARRLLALSHHRPPSRGIDRYGKYSGQPVSGSLPCTISGAPESCVRQRACVPGRCEASSAPSHPDASSSYAAHCFFGTRYAGEVLSKGLIEVELEGPIDRARRGGRITDCTTGISLDSGAIEEHENIVRHCAGPCRGLCRRLCPLVRQDDRRFTAEDHADARLHVPKPSRQAPVEAAPATVPPTVLEISDARCEWRTRPPPRFLSTACASRESSSSAEACRLLPRCHRRRMVRSVRRSMKTFTDRLNATLPVEQPDVVLLAMLQSHQEGGCGVPCPPGQGVAVDGRCLPNGLIAKAAEKRCRPARSLQRQPRCLSASRFPLGNRSARTTACRSLARRYPR